MYCESLEARERYKESLALEDQAKQDELERTKQRREMLVNQVNAAMKGPSHDSFEAPLTEEEQAIREACSREGAFHAPMMVAWLLKHYDEEPTALSGLTFAHRHLRTGEGCFLMHRHGLVQAVVKIHRQYPGKAAIQLLVVKVLKQLLDCNYTRSLVIAHVDALHICFAVSRKHISSLEHLEVAASCIQQYARSEVGRKEIFTLNVIPHLIHYVRTFSRSVPLVRAAMLAMNWATTDMTRAAYVFTVKGVHAALQCLKRHIAVGEVTAPILFLLARLAPVHPLTLELLLKKKTAVLVVRALQQVHNNDALQLEGLKLLQVISKTSEGWKQIDAIRGGWQAICQGTTHGDALVHQLPGALHNPGWAIGDTPYLPLLDRKKLAAAKQTQNDIQPEPKAAWTPHSLREFMGLSMSGQTLAINIEQHETYFELCSTLDVLPRSGEEREAWFQRVLAFEKENEVKIEDMVQTVLQMRRRDAMHKKMAAQNLAMGAYSDEVLGTVKEVFVKGERVTGEILEQKDADVNEALDGVV